MIVKVGLEADTKNGVLEQVAKIAKEHNKIEDESIYLQALLEREEAFTTGCGSGIAIPHGKSSTVKEHGIIICKLKKSIEWHAVDELLVDIVIALMIPEAYFDTHYLTSLAKVARALINEKFINKLRELEEPECIEKMMQEVMK